MGITKLRCLHLWRIHIEIMLKTFLDENETFPKIFDSKVNRI